MIKKYTNGLKGNKTLLHELDNNMFFFRVIGTLLPMTGDNMIVLVCHVISMLIPISEMKVLNIPIE